MLAIFSALQVLGSTGRRYVYGHSMGSQFANILTVNSAYGHPIPPSI